MRISTPKLLTGTMLGVLLCAVAGSPAIARPLDDSPFNSNTTEAQPVQPEQGKVVSLTSNFATIEMSDGERQTLPVARWKLNQLEPGSSVWVAYGRIVAIDSPPDTPSTNNSIAQADNDDYTRSMRGRVASITGNIVTVRLENGDSVNIGVSKAQLGQFVPGTPVMVNDGRIVDMNSMRTNPQQQNMSRMDYNNTPMPGRVASITGNIATVELDNGDSVNIGVSRAQLGQFVPGTPVMVNDGRIVDMNSMRTNSQQQNLSRMDYTAPMPGRVASITGDIVTVRLENGDSVNIGVSKAQLGQFVPGTPVMVNDGRIVDMNSMRTNPQQQNLSRMDYNNAPMPGRVASITGNIATVELDNGDSVNIGVSRAQLGQLVPGTSVMVKDGLILEIIPMSQ